MLTLEEIRELMKDRRILVVAQATGLSHQTIYTAMKEGKNPTYETVKALSDYLENKAG